HLRHRFPPSFPTLRSSDLLFVVKGFVRFPFSFSHDRVVINDFLELITQLIIFRWTRHEPGSDALRVFSVNVEVPEESNTGFELRSEEHTSELQSRENLVCR